jgi:flagellar motor switch/type III secretory pathway protein FliN
MGDTRLKGMDMVEKVNIPDYKELYSQYDWFSKEYPPIVQKACDEFFLSGFQFVLLGISKNINTLMDKDAYFVTKVMIDHVHDMFFRFSEKAIALILERVLGKSETRFNLNRLTDLEAKIITAFNDYMYNAISPLLAPAPPTLKRTNFDVVHLTFVIKDIEKNTCGKFIITLPDVLLKPDVVTSTGENFNYLDFATSTIDGAVKVGTTRLKLIDVKNIDIDDIVVLDNTDTKRMVLKLEDYEKEINLNPNLGLVLPYDNDNEGEEEMAENTNLWDSIEVEMSAQFDSVKITLGELKKIEEGLVVDLTSIYDNKVTLSVEDKPIARGELVIVNDRYGVRIDEVIARGTQTSQSNEQPKNNEEVETGDNSTEETQELSQEQNAETSEEDEFDYSDFELEDEDI